MAGAQVEFLLTPYMDPTTGEAAVGFTVEFYIAGTSTAVTVYADKDLVTPLGTYVTLDARGTALAFVDGLSFLKLVIKNAEDTPVIVETLDGLSYTGGVSGGSLYYLLDGSLPLAGDMNVNGYDLNNVGDINLIDTKSININHGHSYAPLGSDQLVWGDSTGVFRQFVDTGETVLYDGATQLYGADDTSFDFLIPVTMAEALDMGSNKITSLADGTIASDAVNLGQLTSVQAELNDTQVGAGLNSDGTYTPDGGANYISGATSLKNADSLLDAQVKTTTDTIDNIETGGALPPTGSISMFGAAVAPTGWVLCDGASLDTTTYADLFAVIAYTYGGSGANFNVPDCKGRVPAGFNSAETEFDSLGETGGAKTDTLAEANLPSHNHAFSATSGTQSANHDHGVNNVASGVGTVVGDFAAGSTFQANPANITSEVNNQSHTHSVSGTTDPAGSGTAHNNIQPYITLNYIIKT